MRARSEPAPAPAAPAAARVRLHKHLAACGVASRRACEKLMAEGRVRVDGEAATRPGTTVDPERQRIEVDGRVVRPQRFVHLAFHKPPGVVSTARDTHGRRTALHFLRDVPGRVYNVGRLDLDSEGLLLFTNDGDLALQLTHPRHFVGKVYLVWTRGDLSEDGRARFLDGIYDRGECLRAVEVRRIRPGHYRVVLREGRNRQVRRMFFSQGLRVTRLVRVAVGPVELGDLRPGAWRYLEPGEVQALRQAAVTR